MNINYSKIAEIASELEKQLGIQNEIDERTEKEIESQPDLPQPSVEASNINIEEINFQGDLKIENEEEIESLIETMLNFSVDGYALMEYDEIIQVQENGMVLI